MRLIDADKITSGKIAKYLGRGYECCIPDIEDMLKEQPTAYDVDKVVGCIEAIKENGACDEEDCGYCKYLNPCWDGDMSDRLALDKAIEIVKGGERDD